MSKPPKDLKENAEDLPQEKFGILQKSITQTSPGASQISKALAIAIDNLPNYFPSQEKFDDFAQNLIHGDNQEFYEKLLINFKAQGDRANVELLVISCFLRDFLTANNPTDLHFVFTHGGIIPQTLMELQSTESEDKKEELKVDFVNKIHADKTQVSTFLTLVVGKDHAPIILEYLDLEYAGRILEHFLKFSNKSAIIDRRQTLELQQLENIPEGLNLKAVQETIIGALHNINIQPAARIVFGEMSREDSMASTTSELSQGFLSPAREPSTASSYGVEEGRILMEGISRTDSIGSTTSEVPQDLLTLLREPSTASFDGEAEVAEVGNLDPAIFHINNGEDESDHEEAGAKRKRSDSESKNAANSAPNSPTHKAAKPKAERLQTPQLNKSNSTST